MTLTEAKTRVRHLLDQTSTSDTQFDDTNFIPKVLDQGRRMFASILPENEIPKLIKTSSLSVAAGVGSYPSDFLRPCVDPIVTIDSVQAKRIPRSEGWRLRYLESIDLIKSGSSNKYYIERSNGIVLYPSSATACTYEYIMVPPDLDGTDRTELSEWIHDLVVDFAFEKCMGTRRGDMDLAKHLLRTREASTQRIMQ